MTSETAAQTYTTIELLTPNGPEFRRVSTAPARPPKADEIPLIDLSSIDGDIEARSTIAQEVRKAAENTGFFYVHNHGIDESLIQDALTEARAFFAQPLDVKEQLLPKHTGPGVGYRSVSSTQINRTESRDRKETFAIQYDARYDPSVTPSSPQPTDQEETARTHDLIWARTSHLPNLRPTTITFWRARLALARKLVRIFALALSLPETYFDNVTIHPGADALYIHYPPSSPPPTSSQASKPDVGIGSHTDIQLFTLLWQDNSGGLQVLSPTSEEWLDAAPIQGTLVVNVGDFLQRLSNDRFRSTVHRVYNRSDKSRFSMPFFFGFDADTVCEVVSTCVSEERPARYEGISCGEWRRQRFALASKHN
ncbi:2OG-Fe(II)oxygenase superfamily protein [Stagonosporopsis vannaccii]|nr:2OG-Fe(II)oxygenase superfamily protein [Stagonosporopsis vannaccii]